MALFSLRRMTKLKFFLPPADIIKKEKKKEGRIQDFLIQNKVFTTWNLSSS